MIMLTIIMMTKQEEQEDQEQEEKLTWSNVDPSLFKSWKIRILSDEKEGRRESEKAHYR